MDTVEYAGRARATAQSAGVRKARLPQRAKALAPAIAKLHIEGLGGSYGVEKLFHYQMKPEMGIPDTKVYEFPGADESWKIEMQKFEADIRAKRKPDAGLAEARAALKIVETIYRKRKK